MFGRERAPQTAAVEPAPVLDTIVMHVERCDRCGGEGELRVTRTRGTVEPGRVRVAPQVLVFCHAHAVKLGPALTARGWFPQRI